MQVRNKTNLNFSLDDLVGKSEWFIERSAQRNMRSTLKRLKISGQLKSWIVNVEGYNWKEKQVVTTDWGSMPTEDAKQFAIWVQKAPHNTCSRGFCVCVNKLIVLFVDEKIEYPFVARFNVWAHETVDVTFNNADELVRYHFLHELSHALDYIQGLSRKHKETKATRFALRYFKQRKIMTSTSSINNIEEKKVT